MYLTGELFEQRVGHLGYQNNSDHNHQHSTKPAQLTVWGDVSVPHRRDRHQHVVHPCLNRMAGKVYVVRVRVVIRVCNRARKVKMNTW